MKIVFHIFQLNLLFLLMTVSAYSQAQSQKPNIIYIMTDDMGYGDLSCYGQTRYSTPNLDKLAAQGMKFTNAYSAAPVCTPTRTAFMTGRYPARTPVGLFEPLTPTKNDSAYGLSSEYPSIASLMKAAGYETILVGKWHLGFQPTYSPLKNGFDYFFGFRGGAADYISHKGYGSKPDFYENDSLIHSDGYLTDIFTDKAISIIKQTHAKPFFLTLNYNAPHWPWQAPGDRPYDDTVNFRQGGSTATYAAMMKSLDDGIGKIMKAIDDASITENTLVILTNDNGGERFSSNGMLSNSKMSLWEGGIRVPAFVRWPGKIRENVISSQVAVTMDWTATILNAAGATPSKDFPLDGIDLMPVLTGSIKEKERTLYWRTFQRVKQKALRDGNWKYLQDEKGEYLFDLSTDQAEKNDLKAQHADIFNRLKQKYGEWEKAVLKPVAL